MPALHFLASTYPKEDITIAATDAATPRTSIATGPVSSIRATPATPTAAPARCGARGRSVSAAQANSISTTGEVAMIVEAMLVGRICAAR